MLRTKFEENSKTNVRYMFATCFTVFEITEQIQLRAYIYEFQYSTTIACPDHNRFI
jgi:hypothetical protein